MPCVDPPMSGPSYGDIYDLQAKLRTTEAILCGVLKALRDIGMMPAIVAAFDEGEQGVRRDAITKWLDQHLKNDAAKTT